tara:strand:+ start:785 stop:2329 length:1545 start_codon:yes stop_codon:yes gene_type:complete
MKKNYYLTTAISYVNGAPHLGHAYEAVASDALARFKRLQGINTFFLTGTDEHGEKNARSAEAAGLLPEKFTDKNTQLFREMTEFLNISNDFFIRTTSKQHHVSSQHLWNKLHEADEIYLGSYGGWYSVREESYIAEEELIIKNNERYSTSGDKVEWFEEPSYFFKLSKWSDALLTHYEKNPDFIQPNSRRNEVISFVKQGLKDLSISRKRLNWGIQVPYDKEHVMYVWLDALTNYLTGVGYPEVSNNNFKNFWPANIHIIGKDIVRFHAVYWPAFLMAANIELPKKIFCHGFLNIEGNKMSKSLGNVVSPIDLVQKYGLDQLRYFLLREVPFGQDGSFSHEQILKRINGDLANDFGNLAQRVLSMIAKNCNSRIPEPEEYNDSGLELIKSSSLLYSKCEKFIDDLAFHNYLAEIWNVIGIANRYIDHEAPWKLSKTAPKKMSHILYQSMEAIRKVTILLQPFIPASSNFLLDQLSVPTNERTFKYLSSEYTLQPGIMLPEPKAVFPRQLIENQE